MINETMIIKETKKKSILSMKKVYR